MLCSQGVIEGASVGFLYTYVAGARRYFSWREVEGMAKSAGWRLQERYAKYPVSGHLHIRPRPSEMSNKLPPSWARRPRPEPRFARPAQRPQGASSMSTAV